MKKFIRKTLLSPVDLVDLLLVPVVCFVFLCTLLKFAPDLLAMPPEFMDLLAGMSYSPDVIVSFLYFAGFMAGFFIYFCISLSCSLGKWLSDLFVKRREGPEAVKDNLIQVYVDDVVYGRLQEMADEHDISLADFCGICLEAVDPDVLAAAVAELDEEADHADG